MNRAIALVLAAALAVSSCGPARVARQHELVAEWQDALDAQPDIFVIVRPQAIRRDKVYGRFFDLAMTQAQARGFLAGQTMIEAARGAEEIIVGLERDNDSLFVLRGVPASLDPGKVKGASGEPLFRLVSDKGHVSEYQANDAQDAERGTLFVLPDRTWVAATLPARERARQAFATPAGRPAPKLDGRALVVARFGSEFIQRPRYQRSPVFGPLVKKLETVTIALKPESEGLHVALGYQDDDASAWAELQTKELLGRLGSVRDDAPRLAWLRDAKVDREGNLVRVKLPIPPRLLDELPKATGGDLAL